jgi:hippurate hydrolase
MGGEDFSEYGRAGVPALQFESGPSRKASTRPRRKTALPSVPALLGIRSRPRADDSHGRLSLTVAALELLGKP